MNRDIDIGAISEALNYKVDLDQKNTNTQGLSYASGWGMPSNRYIDLELGASGSSYTAPANGYFYFSKNRSGSSNQYAVMKEATDAIPGEIGDGSYADRYNVNILRPVRKGVSLNLYYTLTGETEYFRFIYAEGEQ